MYEPCRDKGTMGSTLNGSSCCDPNVDGGCQTE